MKLAIALEPNMKLVCEPIWRRSHRGKKIKKQMMWKLIKLEVIKPFFSMFATNGVFVRK